MNRIETVTAAYNALAAEDVQLPSTGSPLPALLALRSIVNTVEITKTSVRDTALAIKKARERVRKKEQDGRHTKDLTSALENRLEKLRLNAKEVLDRSFEEQAKEMLQEEHRKWNNYSSQQNKLVKDLNAFIGSDLAHVLATEVGGREKAGSTFRRLLEDLLNAAAEDDVPDPYISIQQVSESTRFIIRANIASVHPNDANKICLQDLGNVFLD